MIVVNNTCYAAGGVARHAPAAPGRGPPELYIYMYIYICI